MFSVDNGEISSTGSNNCSFHRDCKKSPCFKRAGAFEIRSFTTMKKHGISSDTARQDCAAAAPGDSLPLPCRRIIYREEPLSNRLLRCGWHAAAETKHGRKG